MIRILSRLTKPKQIQLRRVCFGRTLAHIHLFAARQHRQEGRKKKKREIAPLRRVSSQEERGVIKRSEGKEWKEERHRSTFGRERNATFAPRVLSTLKPLSKVMGVNRGGRRAVETDGGVKGRQREK